jgi:hypothetical protein
VALKKIGPKNSSKEFVKEPWTEEELKARGLAPGVHPDTFY